MKDIGKAVDPKLSKISVVVPVHNSRRTLEQCLRGLKNQIDSNYEVIIVNDGSTDGSWEICRKSGFKTLSLGTNKGQAVARNRGVEASTGEIIAFVDSDAVVGSDWLLTYRKLLSSYPDADMICSGYDGNFADTEPASFAHCEALYRRLGISRYITSSTSSNCVIYKKAFQETGGYPEYYIKSKNRANEKAVATNEDAELGFLLSQGGKKIVWSHSNPVKHFFRDSWKGYLKQQIGFSRYAVLSVFKFPGMIFNKDIYSREKILPQLAMVLIMYLAILGLFFRKIGILLTVSVEITALLFFYIFHRGFFRHLKSNMKNYSFFKLFFWLVISRVCWLCGVILGLRDGCLLLWSNRFKQETGK